MFLSILTYSIVAVCSVIQKDYFIYNKILVSISMTKEIISIEAPIEKEIRFFLNKIREQLNQPERRQKWGGGQRGTKQKTKSSFLPSYNPSLGSVLTGQKARQVTQKEFKLLSKKKYSGFESRGLIKIIPNKKKVKRKK